ncbi:hypothetical protein Tco_1177970, partial [Tanacetum coccineum]
MLRKGSDFSKESIKKSWEKESAYESGVKFIPCFDGSLVEFIKPSVCFTLLNLPSNWYPLTRVKWLPLMANSFVVSGMVIGEPGVGATTRSVDNSWLILGCAGRSSLHSKGTLLFRRRSLRFRVRSGSDNGSTSSELEAR